ncbi:hypothetical protein KKG46_05550 [Patescibacteria group bacterium]|nr:hypothetical protein [Patescibacteria group bacterium]
MSMKNTQENDALRINEVLEKGKDKASPKDQPYLRMAKALSEDAKEVKEMDAKVMKSQREHLQQMAKNLSAKKSEKSTSKSNGKKSNPLFQRWYVWAGGFATVCAIALLVFVQSSGNFKFGNQDQSKLGVATLSLMIPAAHAGDAFAVQAENDTPNGALVDTTLRVVSKVDVSESDLKDSLRIKPVNAPDNDTSFVDFDIKQEGNGEYVIAPKKDLNPGEVYQVTIQTAVQEDGGEVRPREFSWAIQTQDVFEVIRSVPGNQSTSVPLDTSIEIMLSQTDWEDIQNYFEIKPFVEGKFEIHGRTLVFLPNKPLAPETIYTVTYKKGWGVKNGKSLENDFVIRFETEDGSESESESYLYLTSPTLESSVGKETIVTLSASSELKNTNVEAIGYKISMDDASEVIKQIDEIPEWVYAPDKASPILEKYAKSQVFSFSTQIESSDDVWYEFIRLPNNVEKGFYVVKLTTFKGDSVWFLLQKTNVGAYAMVDRDQILVWVTDHETHKSLSNQKLEMNGKDYETDGQGLARISTPEYWKEYVDDGASLSDKKAPAEYIKIGNDNKGLILPIRYSSMYWYFNYNAGTEAGLNNWSYIFADRPLYRTQDKIDFFGVMQNRDTKQGAGEVTVELRSNSYSYGNYKEKVYASAVLQTDDQGFFKGELQWKGAMKAGYYSLVLLQNGSEAMTRSVEIRDVIKPAYYINITTDNNAVYAGDVVKGNVEVRFFDGTPFANAEIGLDIFGGFKDSENITLKTDDSGMAEFEYKTKKADCDLSSEYPYCGDYTTLQLEAMPIIGEEGEISAQTDVQVWRGKNSFNSQSVRGTDGKAVLEFDVKNVDLSKISGRDTQTAIMGGDAEVVIKSKVYEEYWDKIQTGTYYDSINKTVVPNYRYQRRRVEVGEMQSITDAAGKAILRFDAKSGISYRVISWFDQRDGTRYALYNSIYREGSVSGYTGDFNDDLSLDSVGLDKDKSDYELGDEVELRFYQNKEPFSSNQASYLFVRVANGIKSVAVSQDSQYKFTYSELDIPNVTVYGVAFTPSGFAETQYNASFNTDQKDLMLSFETNQDSYAPGSQVELRAKVTNKNGDPIKDVRIAVAVVDEALMKAARFNVEEYTLSQLYRWLPNGILSTERTHKADGAFAGGGGGAEMGGMMASEAVRKNFKDQAGFMVMQTDKGGYAMAKFTVPDNITSWRLTGVAISPDMQAGNNVILVPVTKPVFVEAVLPQDLLITDKPVLKLRAHGVGLQQVGDINYTISIPTLGVNNQEINGKVNDAVYLALDSLSLGSHKAIINVSAGGKTDAIEKTVNVISTRSSHEEREVIELGPGVSLPDSGISSQIDLVFESKSRASMRYEVQSLAHPWSARLEAVLAGRMMSDLMVKYFADDSFMDDSGDLLAYQIEPGGGLAILPYASADPNISAKAAVAMPDLFDRIELANYFWEITDNGKSSRESSIEALSGLAALGEPVLPRLRIASQQSDLNWREKLAVIRGVEAAGDREAARLLLDDLLKLGEQKDDLLKIKVSDDEGEILEATAQAAALAASMAHPAAESLSKYVQSNWSDDALNVLDRAIYLQRVVPVLSDVDVQIEYAIGNDVKKVDLANNPFEVITLTADEWNNFRIISVNGPAAASYLKRMAGDIDFTSKALSISRSYKNISKSDSGFSEGDIVEVSLSLKWQSGAQDGCYMVRDRLPATLVPLIARGFDTWSRSYTSFAYDYSGGEISFIACKDLKGQNITYKARVVSLGEYTAEGALLQSMRAPEEAVVSLTEKMSVK